MSLECSVERPWGVHPVVRNDASCARCGWVAHGPVGDAVTEAMAAIALVEGGWASGSLLADFGTIDCALAA